MIPSEAVAFERARHLADTYADRRVDADGRRILRLERFALPAWPVGDGLVAAGARRIRAWATLLAHVGRN